MVEIGGKPGPAGLALIKFLPAQDTTLRKIN